MRGIKIPQQDFVLEMPGGLMREGGGGGVFAGHYGMYRKLPKVCYPWSDTLPPFFNSQIFAQVFFPRINRL